MDWGFLPPTELGLATWSANSGANHDVTVAELHLRMAEIALGIGDHHRALEAKSLLEPIERGKPVFVGSGRYDFLPSHVLRLIDCRSTTPDDPLRLAIRGPSGAAPTHSDNREI